MHLSSLLNIIICFELILFVLLRRKKGVIMGYYNIIALFLKKYIMRNVILSFIILFGFNSYSQILEPVKWSTSIEKVSETEYKLIAKAVIEAGWHLYSQNVPDGGPIPTKFIFNEGETFTLKGKTKEGKGETVHDKIFNLKIKYFSLNASFEQLVTVTENTKQLSGTVYFMVCDDERCLAPMEIDLNFVIESENPIVKKAETITPVSNENKNSSEKKGLLGIFLIAFFSGFAALLTPCVFPMIPMTVSFFTKQSKTKAAGIRNAIIYGISIIVIYVLLGVFVSLIFGANALNALSTNVWFNLVFFLLLLVFAASFLGAFEIVLPSSWGTKVDAQADRGGFVGMFFMALALAIVSFSCTGPIVGTLLVEAASGGSQLGPIIGMLGFSFAIALPFALFAAFPGWLNSLPKSGGWLNTVKVFIGFLELALALKFLSMADMAIGGHYIERELFLAIWIGIFLALALYLFGFIKLPHDTPVKYLSVGRTLLATFTLVFVIYLIPGLWGAPLKLISGFDPPKHNYSESPTGFGGGAMSPQSLTEKSELGPHGIYLFHNNLEEGLRYAKESNKPVLLDFTGINCVNCRRMENKVWGESGVIEILKNELVVISLEVDNHAIKLPKEDQKWVVNVRGEREQLKTIGKKWGHLQASRYKTNTQPYYRMVIPLDGEEYTDIKVGSADYEHHGNSDDFQKWLESGISAYEKVK